MTAYGTPADKLRSKEAGIDLHLVKPVDPGQVEDLLNQFEVNNSIRFFPNEKWLTDRVF